MTERGETQQPPTPEQAIRSFRADRLAGTAYEDLIDSDSGTIHCVRYDRDDFADISVNPGNIVTLKTERDAGAIIYYAHQDLLLATNETYLTTVVCSPEAVANFIETLGKRSPDTEVVTLEIDVTPEQPTDMRVWGERWAKDEERSIGILTETYCPDYLRALGHPALIESMVVPELIFPEAYERRAAIQQWSEIFDEDHELLVEAVNRHEAAEQPTGPFYEPHRLAELRVVSGLQPIEYVEFTPPQTGTRSPHPKPLN